MTERLSQLLHDEASALTTPPPPEVATVRAAGHRARRRRGLLGAVAGSVVAVALISAAGAFLGGAGTPDTEPASPDITAPAPPAYGAGSDVHVGDRVAEVPDTVHSLHYTSLGVLVRSNPNGGASDGSGPESLTLVRWDGSTTDLGTIPEGVGPATDPTWDVYVLAEARGEGFEAVVRDAATGDVEQTVPLPDLPPSYWEVPPLALDGSDLFVGYRNETAVVDLDTGEASTAPGLRGGLPLVNGGRVVTEGRRSLDVVDVATGDTVLSVGVDPRSYSYGTLSPDGRYVRVISQELTSGSSGAAEVYDLASGEVVELPGSADWGWTADGDLFSVEGDTVTRCEADTGSCRDATVPTPVGGGDLKLGGVTYES